MMKHRNRYGIAGRIASLLLTFFLAGTSVLLPAGMAVLEVSAVWSEQPDEPAELNPMATFAQTGISDTENVQGEGTAQETAQGADGASGILGSISAPSVLLMEASTGTCLLYTSRCV